MADFVFRTLDAEKTAEINEARENVQATRRVTVQPLEEILHLPIEILDHGFVRTVDYMGDDSAIVQAARVSYGKGTKAVLEDKTLIEYLLRHRHTTPFEMCEIKFHLKMPIFAMRQWIRHRTANVNEYSARYSILDREFYLPEPKNLAAQSKNNKQGRDGELSHEESANILSMLKHDASAAYDTYEYLLNDDGNGKPVDEDRSMLARELARMNLPVNYYTSCFWKIDLHNLLHFLSLRNDPHAQYEIRVYAEQMWKVVQTWVPAAAAAFQNVRMDGISLTGRQLRALQLAMTRDMSNDQSFTFAGAIERIDYEWAKEAVPGLGKREFEEMKTAVTKGL